MKRSFYPKPFPKESIGSIALRACGSDIITLNSLMHIVGGPVQNVHALFIPALKGNATILNELARMEGWQAPKPHKALLDDDTFLKWIDYDHGRFCSECAREGALPWLHDFKDISVCQRHGLTFLTHCDKCQRKLSWNRRYLNICICGHTLKGGKKASLQVLKRNALIERLIVSLQFDRLRRALEMEQIFSTRYQLIVDIELIDAFASGDSQSFAAVFKGLQKHLGNLPPRAVVAPLLSCGQWIQPLVDTLAESLVPHFNSRNKRFELHSFYLTRQELAYTWGTAPMVTGTIQRMLEPAAEGAPVRTSPAKSLIKFYDKLIPRATNAPGCSLRSLKLTITKSIQLAVEGELRIVQFDPLKPLSKILFADIKQNQEFVSMAQAAYFLNTYYEVIRHLGRVKLLQLDWRNGRYVIDAHQIKQFQKRYMLIGEIAMKAGTRKDRRLCEKVAAFGVHPVSGPLVDGGLIYVFLRNEINKLNLKKVAAITRYVTNSGRLPMTTKSACLATYADGTSAALTLGISVQRLTQFEQPNLLQREHPADGVPRLRYYGRSSVERTRRFIARLVPVSDVETQAQLSAQKFRCRYRSLTDEPLYRTEGQEWRISPSAAKLVLAHARNYWDADAAAQFLGASRGDIQNWRILGHLTPLQKNDVGYVSSPMLYRRSDIVKFAKSDVLKNRESALRKKRLRH